MVYDSMSAWGRHAFEFTDNINTYPTKQHSVPNVRLNRHSGSRIGPRYVSEPLYTGHPRFITRIEEEPPSPPASAHDAPSFSVAKSQWSPPPSPRTRSLRSPSRSPASPERKDSAMGFGTSPLSPKDRNALAEKLYAAACAGDLKHIRLLLSLGAPIDTPTMVDGLYDAFKPAKPGCLSALAGAASHGQLAAVKLLLSHGAAINPTMQQSSSSPLHQALRADDITISAFLLSHGADVNLNNCFNTTPLMYAGKYSSPSLVSLILSYNPDLHRLSFINTAAIHWSLWRGNEEVLALLLEAGADPDHAIDNGSTPLHCAAMGELPGIAALLLAFGADVGKRDGEWKTPLQVAGEMGHWESYAVLKEAEEMRR